MLCIIFYKHKTIWCTFFLFILIDKILHCKCQNLVCMHKEGRIFFVIIVISLSSFCLTFLLCMYLSCLLEIMFIYYWFVLLNMFCVKVELLPALFSGCCCCCFFEWWKGYNYLPHWLHRKTWMVVTGYRFRPQSFPHQVLQVPKHNHKQVCCLCYQRIL